VETIDGLLDTIYVAIGWLIELGMTPEQINVCMEEVHASNLTKVDNNGQPIFDDGGKVLKGNNYVKADIPAVLGDALPSGL
jgi:predicted HAD superfamily Cof-like phosphohydrolase